MTCNVPNWMEGPEVEPPPKPTMEEIARATAFVGQHADRFKPMDAAHAWLLTYDIAYLLAERRLQPWLPPGDVETLREATIIHEHGFVELADKIEAIIKKLGGE